jgi:hypothetical protein
MDDIPQRDLDYSEAKERGEKLLGSEPVTPEQALGIAISLAENRTMAGPNEPGPQTARDVTSIIEHLTRLGFEIRSR